MYSPFTSMPDHSRVWVYQSDRAFTSPDVEAIDQKIKAFLANWTAHDQALLASYEIRYNRFIVLMIDEKQAAASGCSIDKSVHFIQNLEKELNLSLMNRMLFAYKTAGNVSVVNRAIFEEKMEKGEITADTIVFNNLVQSKIDLDTKWEVPLKESWHKALLEV
ncbi:MAG: ABC transporter ATPase [Bacteroidetes bacterium]|nr:ABC transporter ATPase [Bacteroidota bacterium]